MTILSELQNYKHDTSGKFKNLTQAINAMNEESLQDAENLELLMSIHECFITMINSSVHFMSSIPGNEMILYLGTRPEGPQLSTIRMNELTLFYEVKGQKISYYLNEFPQNLTTSEIIEKIKVLIPLTKIEIKENS